MSSVLLLLLTYLSARQAADASGMIPREEPSSDCGGCSKRTLFNIIWGCVSTTVICAWSAIHPNIRPREGPFKATLQGLESMIMAILAPEILPGFAFNQLFAAWTIRNLYNEKRGYRTRGFWKGRNNTSETIKKWFSWSELVEDESEEWTLAHGFFMVMGGIRIVEPVEGNAGRVGAKADDPEKGPGLAHEETVKPRVTILTKEMLGLLLDKGIEINLTADEIAYTAKGDALSKAIFLLQSSWFIVHCITRAVQGLALTQFELTTLAMASLNGITILFWWKKPLGAQTVVRVNLKDKLTEEERTGETPRVGGSFRSFIFPSLRYMPLSAVFAVRDTVLGKAHPEYDLFLKVPLVIGLPIAIAVLLLFPIVALIIYTIYTLGDVVLSGSATFPVDATHVPTFYAPTHAFSKNWHPFLLMILATGFGTIHCAGWDFDFPTSQHEKLWRLSSLVVAVVPICLFTILFTVKGLVKLFGVKYEYAERDFTAIASIIFAVIYVVARVIILGQAIALLPHQPPSAFTNVDWSAYYPHIL